MPEHSLTLGLQGDRIALGDFADGVLAFSKLVAALSRHVDAPNLQWEIEALEVSSANTTAHAVDLNGYEPAQAERVVHEYLSVGQALEKHEPLAFPPDVKEPAMELAELVRKGVESIRFETPEADAMLRSPYDVSSSAAAQLTPSAYGAVTGRVQALTSRSGLRFTLYDLLNDKAVGCYLPQGSEDMLRDIWGAIVTVEGWVSRDPSTDRPVTIRRIASIERQNEPDARRYRGARGRIHRRPGDPWPEERIDRLRNGD